MRDHYIFAKDLTDPKARWHIELELEPSELEAMGLVFAQWAFLEFLIREHSVFMLRDVLKEEVPREVESDSFRKRKRVWEELAKRALPPEHRDRVLDIARRIGSMQNERNKLTHGLLQWDENDPDRLKVFSRDNPHGAPWRVDTARISAVARKIATLNADFLNVHNENPDFPDLAPLSLQRRPGIPVRLDQEAVRSQIEIARSLLEGRKSPPESSEA